MSGYVVRHDRRIEVERLNTGIKPRPRAEPFVQVPLSWAVKAAKVCVLEPTQEGAGGDVDPPKAAHFVMADAKPHFSTGFKKTGLNCDAKDRIFGSFSCLVILPLLASGAYCTAPASMALRASCKA